MQDPAGGHRLPPHLDDLCDGDQSEMSEEGLFLLGVGFGFLLYAVAKIFLGLFRALTLGLTP